MPGSPMPVEPDDAGPGARDIGPDMIVGYTKGTRGSDDSALGGVTGEVLANNEKPWSGDHCMDMPAVPGILATSRPLKRKVARLKDLAAAVLAEFDIQDFPLPVSHAQTTAGSK